MSEIIEENQIMYFQWEINEGGGEVFLLQVLVSGCQWLPNFITAR